MAKVIFSLLLFFTTVLYAGVDANGHFDNADTFWTETHYPSAATKATKSHAAESGKRHVVTCVSATIATDSTAQTPIAVQLIDDTTPLATWTVSAPANGQGGIALCGLKFIGTANKAMTLEFSGAGVSSSRQSVAMQGYTVR